MWNQKTACVALIMAVASITLGYGLIYQSFESLRREKPQNVLSNDSSLRSGKKLSEHTYSQLQMAMPVRITVWSETTEQAETASKLAFKKITELVKIFSNFDRDSEVRRLLRRRHGQPIQVSGELFAVFKFSERLHAESAGAFDPAAGPMISLWRKARLAGELPEPDSIGRAKRNSGFRHIEMDEEAQTITLLRPSMEIDFGGIAKGFIGDNVMKVLKDNGIEIACYQAGGDFVMSGAPPGTDGWDVDVGDGRSLALSDCGISTSGDAVQFMEIEGRRYSHVIDPRTGIGLTSERSAFAIAPLGMQSDALATTGSILGGREFQILLKSYKNANGWSVQKKR